MKANEIKTLLLILASGVFSAILLAWTMLYIYNPDGSYRAANVLLSPEAAFSLNFSEPTGNGKKTFDQHFKSMTFNFYDTAGRRWKDKNISKDEYAAFYKLVSNDRSEDQNLIHPALTLPRGI